MGVVVEDNIRVMLGNIRHAQKSVAQDKERKIIKENIEQNNNAIAITDDPRFGQNALTNQISQFRSAVESGAQFTKPGESKVSECPLIFIPSTSNLIFSGTIPCLNNLKFQFVLKTNTGNGCFVWADELILNKDNIQILNKLYGYYLNWKDQWNSESADLEKMINNLKNM
jgi:hypothetical protein